MTIDMMLKRVWPRELEVYRDNPRAVPMQPGSYADACANCGGMQVMMIYVIDAGPFKFPNGGKVKWLDFPEVPDIPGRPTVSGWYTGKLEVAFCPVCRGDAKQRWLDANCGLAGDDLDVSLSDFRITPQNSGKAKALSVAKSLLAQNQQPSGFVTLYGGYGVGKTHLLKSLVNGFRKIGVLARYARMSDLLAEIRDWFGEERGVQAAEVVISDLRNVRVLCLDEIDRVNLTGWAKETVFRLLDARWTECNHLLTVLASNLAPDNLPAEFGYLESRMRGGVVVEVGGYDMRPGIGLRYRRELIGQDG